MTPAEAESWFDSLAPATEEDMAGEWRGEDVPTGHKMDGMLAASSWTGKRFTDAESVFPLIHNVPFWGERALNPRFMPLGLIMNLPARDTLLRVSFPLLAPLFFTTKPRARLRTIRFRGRDHAAMIYDDKPINDVFAKIDDTSVLGWMDFKGMSPPYFFKLTR